MIEWLRAARPAWGDVTLGIGDDMAMLAVPAGRVLLSSDMLLDGVHFDSTVHSLASIGRKAVACGLSDCAAMAVRPVAVTVSVAWPADWTLEQAKELARGMFEMADNYDVAIAGGDTTRWREVSGRLCVDVAIAGVPHDGIEPIRRSGARAGDGLFVTGPLGGSLQGRHLTFTPRAAEARLLAERLGGRLHAMMDISDGLSLDLWRMCQASDVGAVLDAGLLEAAISDAAREAAKADGRSALDHALGDGEDFELLMAIDASVDEWPIPLLRVGDVTCAGLGLRTADGTVETLEPKGFSH